MEPANFEQVYREHAGQVYGLCLRMTGQPALAEDCTQECFISAWRSLGRFEARSQMSTWLYRIAVNTVLTHRRRRPSDALRDAGELDDEALHLVGESGPSSTADIEAALQRMPQGARDVLVLVGIYGHTHEEAADMLGIAVGTSKAQLHRARRLMAQQLGIDQESA
jgi:RNA polymerase sigma-70 factor (ECF subfamily)